MIAWIERPGEERALLNPSFCSSLLWQASAGYHTTAQKPLPFALAFLVLPIVLHFETRESLPKTTRTSLAVWLSENPLSRPRVADRARTLLPFTKEAIIFGGAHGLFKLRDAAIAADSNWRKRVAGDLKESTEEVRNCAKRAEFIGKWFASSGSAETVMAIFGVCP